MDKSEKIYVSGHTGLVGSALMRRLQADGYTHLVARTHGELDLTEQRAVREFFQAERPDYVFLAAAKVGGILANDTYPAEFIYQNIAIQTNIIHEAWRVGVKRLLLFGSSCIYPRECPQPIKEEYLLTGPLEATNRPYALAKISGVELCWAYNRQYGTRYLAVMPTNLYGRGDNYDPQTSHVLPALIRKMHEAKVDGRDEVIVWGTGKPRREFLFSDDMAEACVFLMNLPDEKYGYLLAPNEGREPPLINLGCGQDLTIRELAELVAEVVGFAGRLRFDPGKPDGTPRKLLDMTRLHRMGWRARTGLREGIRQSYQAFLQSQG